MDAVCIPNFNAPLPSRASRVMTLHAINLRPLPSALMAATPPYCQKTAPRGATVANCENADFSG